MVSADSEGSGNGTSKPAVTAEQRKAAFQSHMDSFLASLHAVDVQLRRSIMGLNEAGIIRLRPTTQSTVPLAAPVPGMPGAASSGPVVGGGGGGPPGPDDHHAASVYPTGSGTIGARLDVGWLNARGGKVEREMEAELWARARAFLEREAALGDASGLLSQDYDVGTHGRERKKEEEIGAGVDGSGDVEGDDDDDYDSDDNDDDESSEDDSDDGVDSDVNVKAEDTEMHGVDNPV